MFQVSSADQPVILMRIFAVVREDQIRRDRLLQFFEDSFTSAPTNGMNPSGKVFSSGSFSRGWTAEQFGGAFGFRRPAPRSR